MTEVMVYGKGDHVRKTGGDYRYEGVVVSAFVKLDPSKVRYVVEDARGLLFIFNGRQLELLHKAVAIPPTRGGTVHPIMGIEDVELPE